MYQTITTLVELERYIGPATLIAADIECSPREQYRNEPKAALDPHKADITGISFSIAEGTGVYVPLTHKVGKNANADAEYYAAVHTELNDSTANVNVDTTGIWTWVNGNIFQNPDITLVCHNLVFEASFFYGRGIVPKCKVYDTMLAAQMVLKGDTAFRKLADCGLKTLVPAIYDVELPTFDTITNGRHFDELDPADAETTRYACADSDFALQLYHTLNDWFDKWLPRHRYIVSEVESPSAVYVGIMRYNGILVNRALMEAQRELCEKRLAKLREDIAFIIGDVNIGANASMAAFKDYLYKHLNLPVLKSTAKQKEAADEETFVLLRDWCAENRQDLTELFDFLLEYRRLGKLLSTYVAGYLKHVDITTTRVYPSFLQLGAESGRFSCQKPNVQNNSNDKDINTRNFIIAPENFTLMELDYSQIEARIAAYLSRDEVLLDIYANNKDLHAMTTAAVFPIPLSEAADKHHPDYKHRRTVAKATFFGFLYGMFAKTLQRNLKLQAGVTVTFDEAKRFLENLKRSYPTLTAWQRSTINQARHDKYAETALGRRRYVPDIRSGDFIKSGSAERSALNHGVQGLAADLLKLSMGRIIAELPPYVKPIFTVHDSLIFEVPDERVHEAAALIKAAMEVTPPVNITTKDGVVAEFDVPIIAEVSVGKTYGEMKEL